MSALLEQHGKWSAARNRLWGAPSSPVLEPEPEPAPVPAPVIIEPKYPQATPAAPVTPYFAPFDFLKPPSPKAIIKLVSLRYGVATARLLSPERTREVVAARNQAIVLIRQHCSISLPKIARIFHRDHTTILHSLRITLYGRRKGSGTMVRKTVSAACIADSALINHRPPNELQAVG